MIARWATRLKGIPRTGWLDRGIPPRQVESVADHSLGVALLAWASAVERQSQGLEIDPARVALLAIFHDLGEAETGDIPPYDPAALPAETAGSERRAFLDLRHVRDKKSQAAKRANEDAAVRGLLEVLPDAVRSDLRSLWEELHQGTSVEARFVKQVDRLETFLQSRAYLTDNPEAPMESFRHEALQTLDDPLLTAMRDATLADERSGEHPSDRA